MKHSDRLYSYKEIDDNKLIEFSEGNDSLYKLLKYCYEHNIHTHACCKGHENEISKPYISFFVNNVDQMSYVIDSIMNSRYSDQFMATISNFDNLKLALYCLDLRLTDMFFDLVKKSFKEYRKDSKYNRIFEINDFLKDQGKLFSINIHNDFIEISNPIYKKIIINNGKEVYTNDEPEAGDMVYEVDNRKFYLPDDIDAGFIKDGQIIRDKDIFKNEVEISCSIIISNEFFDEFYDKVIEYKNKKHGKSRI